MAEYIERDAIKAKKVYSTERREYVVPVAEIDWQPAADVKEVVHGKWQEIKCGDGLFDYYFSCSECKGNTPPRAYPTAPDFCPNCGADMRGSA